MTESDGLTELFRRVTAGLEHGGFRYAVVGAFARNVWARVRATTDLDFAIALDGVELNRLMAMTQDLGLLLRRPPAEDPEGGPIPILLLFCAAAEPDVKVDFLVVQTPFEQSALDRRCPVLLLGQPCHVISPEDVLVYKLVAGRPRDLADVDEVARTQRARGAEIDWDYVERWTREFGIQRRVAELRERLDGKLGGT